MKWNVFMSRTIKILTSDTKIQPAFTCREGSRFWLFSPWSPVGHALRPIFMLWLVKIWQVSSWGKFMQHLETCILIAEVDRVLCRHLVICTKWIELLSRFFCNSWLVCLLGLWLRNAPLVKIIGNPVSNGIFSFFHLAWFCLMRKRVQKAQLILALLDGLQELHLDR